MSTTWRSGELPAPVRIGPAGWLRVSLRGGALVVVVLAGLVVLLILRLIERPLFGLRRPMTPHVTRTVCRLSLAIIGLRWSTRGEPMATLGAMVANHVSWLDILVLNAQQNIYFVSKAEVAGWPAIGLLARATGTVFINRSGREAQIQKALFEARLRTGHRLLFFPEGTSTDGLRVLDFKSTLFAAFFTDDLKNMLQIQPVTLRYTAPEGADGRFYGWWGDMAFGGHFLKVLAAPRQGAVEVIFHPSVRPSGFSGRKALAAHCEAAVRGGLGNGAACLPS